MKIMVIFPTWTGEYGLFSYFARKASTWPPLNLAYVAAAAEEKGHEVRIIAGEAERLTFKDTIDEVIKFGPGLVGMPATTPFFHLARELACGIKEADKSIPIIIGGPHITILKEKAFFDWFDYAFLGEAEGEWPRFLERLEKKEDL